MSLQHPKVALSVIVPVGARRTNIVELYAEYRSAIATLGCRVEFIFVLDGSIEDQSVAQLAQNTEDVTLVGLTRSFGESTAVMAGFEYAKGELLLVLPAYHQIDAQEIPKLVMGLDSADLVVAYRSPRRGGGFERLRRKGFHVLLSSATGLQFNDSAARAPCAGGCSRRSSFMAISIGSCRCSPTGKVSASGKLQ
jgi:glycosyltransferase involved in cell wall biosynthesis